MTSGSNSKVGVFLDILYGLPLILIQTREELYFTLETLHIPQS